MAVRYATDDYDAPSSDKELSLSFKYEKGTGMIAKHKGITYVVSGEPMHDFGKHRILRDGHDWLGRTFNSHVTAMSVAADIAQATGKQTNSTFDLV